VLLFRCVVLSCNSNATNEATYSLDSRESMKVAASVLQTLRADYSVSTSAMLKPVSAHPSIQKSLPVAVACSKYDLHSDLDRAELTERDLKAFEVGYRVGHLFGTILRSLMRSGQYHPNFQHHYIWVSRDREYVYKACQ
jgi:hypothetical protein